MKRGMLDEQKEMDCGSDRADSFRGIAWFTISVDPVG